MNKKLIIFIILSALMLVLAACGNNKSNSHNSKDSGTSQTQATKDNRTGSFGGKVSGMAAIKDGKLMLTNFKTEEGPDLHVYLTKNGDVASGKKIDKIDLKNTEQTFSVSGITTTDYDTVVIYCDKAHETFGAAKLK
ncbi:DM13 domain-containing protein [Bacillus cereus]|uniref:DM13 domain-containing protein n=1 Tax=Bacillus cereus TaxID=1396 RepID=UPI000BEC4063|nr:DM13 domain-containing protein [Bacillus cereus]PEF61868.1 hypothetical protein CON35_23060 [Bacillus cereus]